MGWLHQRRSYGGRWSKTMVGYGPEDKTFAMELTYNYGVPAYEKGSDLRCIGIRSVASPRNRDVEPEFTPFNRTAQLDAASSLSAPVLEDDDGLFVSSPDGYAFKLIDDSHLPEASPNPVLLVSLWVSNLKESLRFWRDGMGMVEIGGDNVAGSTVVHKAAAWLQYAGDTQSPALELVQLPEGCTVEHADAFGRIAFATAENPATLYASLLESKVVVASDAEASAATSSQGRVVHAPVRLETPGKADVDVVILGDPDGYEVCLVGMAGFCELATHRPGDDFINWAARAARGGDGHPPPAATPDAVAAFAGSPSRVVSTIDSDKALEDAVAAGSGTEDGFLVVKVYGTWCKHCAKISAKFETMATELSDRGSCSVFAQVDVDKVPSIIRSIEGGLKRVPAFFAFKHGRLVAAYVGSSERRLARFMMGVAPAPDGGGIILSDGRVVEPQSAAGPLDGISVFHASGGGGKCTAGGGCPFGPGIDKSPSAADAAAPAAAGVTTSSHSVGGNSTASEEDCSAIDRAASAVSVSSM